MFKEINLSQAVPPNAVAVRFRYEITGSNTENSPVAELADNAAGDNPIHLAGNSGEVTIRFRTAQKLYYSLQVTARHLNLWIVEWRELKKQSC